MQTSRSGCQYSESFLFYRRSSLWKCGSWEFEDLNHSFHERNHSTWNSAAWKEILVIQSYLWYTFVVGVQEVWFSFQSHKSQSVSVFLLYRRDQSSRSHSSRTFFYWYPGISKWSNNLIMSVEISNKIQPHHLAPQPRSCSCSNRDHDEWTAAGCPIIIAKIALAATLPSAVDILATFLLEIKRISQKNHLYIHT